MDRAINTAFAAEQLDAFLAFVGCATIHDLAAHLQAHLRGVAGRDDVSVDGYEVHLSPDGLEMAYRLRNWPEPLDAVKLSGAAIQQLLATHVEAAPG